jgi:hypothetical protein
MIESYSTYLSEESTALIKEEADNILAHDEDQKLTWWYGFDRHPENIIEQYIFESARKHNMYHSYVGAEWWIRSHDDLSSYWYFHVDGDLDRFNKDGVYYPAPFCTVTYLTNSGQPTILLDQYHDWSKTDGVYITGEDSWSFWSSPKAGKHITWAMPYFHGVPSNYGEMYPGEKRITLMYNIWKTKPYEPACVEYNLPYEIKKGSVTLTPQRDKDLLTKEPQGWFGVKLEGIDHSVQYHGINEQGASWFVSQYLPDELA